MFSIDSSPRSQTSLHNECSKCPYSVLLWDPNGPGLMLQILSASTSKANARSIGRRHAKLHSFGYTRNKQLCRLKSAWVYRTWSSSNEMIVPDYVQVWSNMRLIHVEKGSPYQSTNHCLASGRTENLTRGDSALLVGPTFQSRAIHVLVYLKVSGLRAWFRKTWACSSSLYLVCMVKGAWNIRSFSDFWERRFTQPGFNCLDTAPDGQKPYFWQIFLVRSMSLIRRCKFGGIIFLWLLLLLRYHELGVSMTR